jgi:hypothetical protein
MGRRANKLSAVQQLIAASAGSGLIYIAYLVFIAFLPEHLGERRLTIFSALGRGYQALAIYLAAVGILFALAVVAWRAARAGQGWRVQLWALLPPIVFGGILVLTIPLTSRDIFYYISSARVLSVYGTNPYLAAPSAFPNDPLFQYANWPDYTSPYGPLWLVVSATLTRLGAGDLFWSVVLFKMLAFVCYLLCGVLIWTILRARGKDPLAGAVFWLWNPLALLEFSGAGHNDVLMLVGLLLGLWLYLTGRVRLALAALTLAAMTKLVALIVMPLILWHHLASRPGWLARGREAARVLWLPAAIVVACLAPFWAGASTFGPVKESSHYYSSFAHVARIVLEWFLSPRLSGEITRGGLLLILAVGYLLILWRTPGDSRSLLTGLTRAFFLLLILWSFFVPWYCAWVVAVAAALASGRHNWRALLLGAGATISYVFQFFLPLRMAASVELRSSLSAVLIFLPFLLTFVPWERLWRGQRGRGHLLAPPRT